MWLSVSGKEGRHLEFSQRTNGNTGDRAYVEPGPVFVSPSGTMAVIFAHSGIETMRENPPENVVLLGVVTAPPHVDQPAPPLREWEALTRIELAGATNGAAVFRVFDQQGATLPAPCPGYLDGQGKPFAGGLSLVIPVEFGSPDAWRIQDDPTVPGASAARARARRSACGC